MSPPTLIWRATPRTLPRNGNEDRVTSNHDYARRPESASRWTTAAKCCRMFFRRRVPRRPWTTDRFPGLAAGGNRMEFSFRAKCVSRSVREGETVGKCRDYREHKSTRLATQSAKTLATSTKNVQLLREPHPGRRNFFGPASTLFAPLLYVNPRMYCR